MHRETGARRETSRDPARHRKKRDRRAACRDLQPGLERRIRETEVRRETTSRDRASQAQNEERQRDRDTKSDT